MAALNLPQNGQANTRRTKKAPLGVDLTAMVDLAFLLITFFMLTTSLAKMRAMDVVKPVDGVASPWPESRTMTILLGKHNQVVHYMGSPNRAEMRSSELSSIKGEILAYKRQIAATHADEIGKRMLVIIKPTDGSIYQNLVDILDEMQINGVSTYAISDQPVLDEEAIFMKKRGI
ncbi:MAG: biopolymer transporter ExbD [Pedobacter sp.]|nr:biopolymer transporter ExbD [Pedobacter sp.]MDQ8053151.1 biopolymer transporter ExbD [Pedobacter sp.]